MEFLKKALPPVRMTVHILSFVCYAIIGIYALVCAPMIVGMRPEVVSTGSMTPTYNVGTIIYYKHVDKSEINENDVISYKLNDNIVTHRVIAIENDMYVTKGDNNNVKDAKPVSYENVEGKVVGPAIPVLGYGVAFINRHMFVIFILVAILLAEFLLSNLKHDKISVSEKGQEHEKKE